MTWEIIISKTSYFNNLPCEDIEAVIFSFSTVICANRTLKKSNRKMARDKFVYTIEKNYAVALSISALNIPINIIETKTPGNIRTK